MKTTTSELQQLVLQETDDGLRPVRFLMDVMNAEFEGVKMADRMAAAREILDRCWGKPFTAACGSSEISDGADDPSDVLVERILRVIDEVSDDEGEAADD